MSSGKQTSFSYGEVAPIQKYKANEIYYANALEKLRNAFVRRTGGITNRQGTVFAKDMEEIIPADILSEWDESLFAEGEAPPIRTFQIESESAGLVEVTLVLDVDPLPIVPPAGYFTYRVYISNKPSQSAGVIYLKDKRQILEVELLYFKGWFIFTPSYGGRYDGPGSEIFAVGLRDSLISEWATSTVNVLTSIDYLSIFNAPFNNFPLVAVDGMSRATASPTLFTSVTYIVTAESTEGVEYQMDTLSTQNVDANGAPILPAAVNDLYYPSSEFTNYFRIDFGVGGPEPQLKRVNFYRAVGAGPDVSGHSFSLVGRVIPRRSQQYGYFSDNGISDPAISLPSDLSLMVNAALVTGQFALGSIKCAANYQERFFAGYLNTGNIPELKTGDIIATKIGSLQLARPPIVRPTDAFSFSVPALEASDVVALLSDKRLIAFTKQATYLIAGGGEQGIITAQEINPLRIAQEGCSETVRPRMLGSIGVFLNHAHNKLMAVIFNGEKGVQVAEISEFSSHLIDQSIIQMETLSSPLGDDYIFLLRSDGSVVAITLTSDGKTGFSVLSFRGGRVLSMYKARANRAVGRTVQDTDQVFETIAFYVVRNNFITLEYFDEKRDGADSPTMYADHALQFGGFLTRNGVRGYSHVYPDGGAWWNTGPLWDGKIVNTPYLNIELITDWLAGSKVLLRFNRPLAGRVNDQIVVEYFYEEGGNLKAFYLYPDWNTEVDNTGSGGVYTVEATASHDIPEQLRDVQSQANLTIGEKAALGSRWLIATDNWTDHINRLSYLYLSYKSDTIYDYNIQSYVDQDGSVELSVSAENVVMSSPLNPEGINIKLTKVAGIYLLDSFPQPVSGGYIGIPYISSLETLPIEPPDNRTLTDDQIIINKVGLALHETGRPYIGMAGRKVEDMVALVTRSNTDISVKDKLFSGHLAPIISSEWTFEGRIGIINVDPAPMNVMAIYPKGLSAD